MLLMGGIFAFCLIFMAGRLGYLMIGQADKYLALAKRPAPERAGNQGSQGKYL